MHVFVYGTLTDPDRVAEVLDGSREWSFVGDATLRGLHRVDGRYPTLAPGGRVDGRLLETDAVDTLDAYEGVDRGLYVRVPVPYDAEAPDSDGPGSDESDGDDPESDGIDSDAPDSDGELVGANAGEAAVYVGDPERLGVDQSVPWPDAGDLDRRVRRYVDANDVTVLRR